MLFPVCLLVMMMMKMKSYAYETITAHHGESVLLTPQQLKEEWQRPEWDVRWTNLNLMVSWKKKNGTLCHHKRCSLERNGTLAFSHVQREDAGNYTIQVFDPSGVRLLKNVILLKVEGAGQSQGSSGVWVRMSFPVILILLLSIIIIIIITVWRRSQRVRSTAPVEENLYMAMHGNRGNQKKEEESQYVHCDPVVSMGTPITGQKSVDEDNIYV